MKSALWGSSIAMAWMWGLGLFFSVHFTFLYGWAGLLSFAVPNALGLVLFGWVLQRRGKTTDLGALIEKAFIQHSSVFALYQISAVSLTLFALIAYFLVPLGFSFAAFAALAVLFIGALVSEVAGFNRLVRLHAGYAVIAIAAVVVLVSGTGLPPAAPMRGDVSTLSGFVVPLVVGLLLGPFYDIQQWQRAAELQRRGQSIARAFGIGGAIFFAMLLLNGLITIQLTGELAMAGFVGSDGIVHAQSAVSEIVAQGQGLPLALYAVWVLLCVLSTFDSAQAALGWFVPRVVDASENALLRMIPADLIKSTVPFFAIAAAVAIGMWYIGGHLEYFMILYATLFVPYSAILARDLWRGEKPSQTHAMSLLAGIASLLITSAGYFNTMPVLMIVGTMVALLPLVFETEQASPEKPESDSSLSSAPGIAPAGRDLATIVGEHTQKVGLNTAPASFDLAGHFDGNWFEIKLTATYSDTNSVGNIYFANYVSWVGKARELFFRKCMPGFDLKETNFYILTRSFTHKFVREAREFEEVVVRLRIKDYNRKFVKLEHKLFNGANELLGEGEQSLMFVNTENYGLTDIPADVVVAFTPHL